MAIRVVQCNNHLELVAYLDAMHVRVLHAFAELFGKVKLCVHNPAFLTRVINHVVPVIIIVHCQSPVFHFSLPLVLANHVAVASRQNNLMHFHQPAVDFADLEALEQGREPRLKRNGGPKHNSLLWDDDAVFDLVRPDVLDAHSMQKLQRRGLQCPDYSDSFLGVQVVC